MNVRRGLPVTSFGVDPPREKHDGSAPPSFFSPGLLILYAEKSGYEMHQVDKHRVHASFRIAPNERLLYIVRLFEASQRCTTSRLQTRSIAPYALGCPFLPLYMTFIHSLCIYALSVRLFNKIFLCQQGSRCTIIQW